MSKYIFKIAETEKELKDYFNLRNEVFVKEQKIMTDTEIDEYENVINTNLTSVFALTKECLKIMIPRQDGVVIMVASMAALYGIPKVAAYSSAKTGLLGLTRSLATEVSQYGIRINAIAPGFIESEMSKKALDGDVQRKKRILERTPMARLGQPEDIGNAAVYLASDAASYVSGIVLPVDGGNSIGF